MNFQLQYFKDTSLNPSKEEFEEALYIMIGTFEGKYDKLYANIKALFSLTQQGRTDYLNLPQSPLKKLLTLIYKIPQKRSSQIALYSRIVAKNYCYQHNDFLCFRKYAQKYRIPFPTNEFEYKNTLFAIIIEAFRGIEDQILKNFVALDFKRLDERQIRYIQPILTSIQSIMSTQSTIIFKRQIANILCLEKHVPIELTEYYIFYNELRAKMQLRVAQIGPLDEIQDVSLVTTRTLDKDAFRPNYSLYCEKEYNLTEFKNIPKHHSVFQDDPTIWTPEIQHQIVGLFLQFRELSYVRTIFQRQYADCKQLCDIGRIKRKLIKIIRSSVRMLQKFYKHHKEDADPPLPKMIQIDEDKVKLLIGSPYEIKACLCQFFRQNTMNYRSICETINEINYFIRQKSLSRFQKSTPSKAIIFSL